MSDKSSRDFKKKAKKGGGGKSKRGKASAYVSWYNFIRPPEQ
jgi:hypothetical protein